MKKLVIAILKLILIFPSSICNTKNSKIIISNFIVLNSKLMKIIVKKILFLKNF